jgi:hypothetical protein
MDNGNATDTEALIRRVEELEARLTQLTRARPTPGEPTTDRRPTRTVSSRRDLFKMAGGVAVGGAAASLLAASPASADDGNGILMGDQNVAEAPTWLRYNGTGSIGTTDLLTVYDGPAFNSSDFPSAIAGWAASGAAEVSNGVYGYTTVSGGYGSIGFGNGDAAAHGVWATSTAGYGLVADGGLAPIWLKPAGSAGAPTSGAHAVGELYVDSNGVLYQCIDAGSPGTWAQSLLVDQTNNTTGTTSVTSTSGSALQGTSTGPDGIGVVGTDNGTGLSGVGVQGNSTTGAGVYATSTSGSGVYATSTSGTGLQAYSADSNGIYGQTAGEGIGVAGNDVSTGSGGSGVYGSSTSGYGLVGSGGRAPLRILPAATAGSPSSGSHQLGEVYVDSAGVIYKCVRAGTPGQWAPVNSTVLLASPVRVIDTRKGTGIAKGPLRPTTTYTSKSLIGGSSAIPPGALGLVGTLAMVGKTTKSTLGGVGYLTIFPGGTRRPATWSVNGDTSHAIASGVTVRLGTGANAGKVSLVVGGTKTATHAVLDVAAYII